MSHGTWRGEALDAMAGGGKPVYDFNLEGALDGLLRWISDNTDKLADEVDPYGLGFVTAAGYLEALCVILTKGTVPGVNAE